jgi:hypothetical protein
MNDPAGLQQQDKIHHLTIIALGDKFPLGVAGQ